MVRHQAGSERTVLLILGLSLAVALLSGGSMLNFYRERDAVVGSARLLSNVASPPSTLRRHVLSDSSFPKGGTTMQLGDLRSPMNHGYTDLTAVSRKSKELAPTNPQPPHCHHRRSLLSAQSPPLPGKKGIGFTLRADNWKVNVERIKQLNVSWNYSWDSKRIAAQPDDVEFLPMIWGSAGGVERVNRKLEMDILPEFKANRVHRLLPFNEPDNRQ
jgi:Glycosyl hydrolase catalytic core